MADYRRTYQPGGTFFLTLVTHQRAPLFSDAAARHCLHDSLALAGKDRPFELVGIVLLPDHLHLIMTLPNGDADFSVRVAAIKARFTRAWLTAGGDLVEQSSSRCRHGYRGVWQKRFWEHHVRDETDLNGCLDYIHFNPVKHGLVECPHAWQWSSFHRFVRDKRYDSRWCCACDASASSPPPGDIQGAEITT